MRDFAYTDTRNYWAAHKHTARKVVVGGVYEAGAYRPPVELDNGATLDLSGMSDSWDATGHTGNISKNDTYISNNPGQVTFASGATITVDIHGRLFSSRTAEKVVGWSAQPAGVTFKLDSESAKLFAMRVRDDGLYVIGKGGMAILMR